ncbi:MAG: hypothetical protein U1F83_13205 [Verrucomicrobiota bacterium]
MKNIIETTFGKNAITRRFWIGCLSLLTGATLTAMAGSNALAKIWRGAKEARSLVVWYVRSDEWRADARAYRTYAEFLFCPSSGVENQLEFDEEEVN